MTLMESGSLMRASLLNRDVYITSMEKNKFVETALYLKGEVAYGYC